MSNAYSETEQFDTLLQAYIKREHQKPTSEIVRKSMIKLGYLDFNTEKEKDMFIKKRILEYIDKKLVVTESEIICCDNITKHTIEDIFNIVLESQEYLKFQERLSYRLKRKEELIHFIDSNNYIDFFKNLTLSELKYIGY